MRTAKNSRKTKPTPGEGELTRRALTVCSALLLPTKDEPKCMLEVLAPLWKLSNQETPNAGVYGALSKDQQPNAGRHWMGPDIAARFTYPLFMFQWLPAANGLRKEWQREASTDFDLVVPPEVRQWQDQIWSSDRTRMLELIRSVMALMMGDAHELVSQHWSDAPGLRRRPPPTQAAELSAAIPSPFGVVQEETAAAVLGPRPAAEANGRVPLQQSHPLPSLMPVAGGHRVRTPLSRQRWLVMGGSALLLMAATGAAGRYLVPAAETDPPPVTLDELEAEVRRVARLIDQRTPKQVRTKLDRLRRGDHYFFVWGRGAKRGECLYHSVMTLLALQHVNVLQPTPSQRQILDDYGFDDDCKRVIERLTDCSDRGGCRHPYVWPVPNLHQKVNKVAYVTPIEVEGWGPAFLGSGLYWDPSVESERG